MAANIIAVNTNTAGSATYTAAETNDPPIFGDDLIVNAGVTVSVTAGNLDLQAGDDILLAGSATASGVVVLQAGFGDLDGAGGISQTGGAVTATQLRVLSIGAVTLNQAGNDVGDLAASVTGTGGFSFTDGNDVFVATLGAINGVQTNNGDVSLTSVAGSIVLNGGAVDDIRALSGDVVVNAALNVEVRNDSADAIDAQSGNVLVTAGQDILLGSAATDDFGDVEANGDVTLNAGRDVIVDENTFVDAFAAGLLTVTAGRNISILASDGSTGAQMTTQGGAIALTTGADDVLIVDSDNAQGAIRTTNAGGNGNIAINADRVDITLSDSIRAGTGVVTFQGASAGRLIDLGSTTNVAVNTLELSDAELDRTFASQLHIGNAASGNIAFTAQVNPANVGTMSLQTGGAIQDNNLGTDLTVGNLALRSAAGIGDSGVFIGLDTAVSTLAFNNTGGAVDITDDDDLTIGAVDGLAASSNTGTLTTLTAAGLLTVAVNLTSSGTATLTAVDAAGAGRNLTINGGVTVQSTAGNLFLQAGDDFTLAAGANLQALGAIMINIDSGNADAGVGGIANLNGTLNAAFIQITGGSDGDTVNTAPSVLANLVIDGLGGDDTLGGGGGDDNVTGGAGDDRHVFRPGGGADTFHGFVAGQNTDDRADISAFGITRFGQVLALATQAGADTVINFGGGDTLTLANVVREDLAPEDFGLLQTPNDFDADGDADILWRHDNGTTNLFLMDGATVLGGSNLTAQADNAWAFQDKNDFNGDGHTDILWRHQNGTANIFLMDGATVLGGSNLTAQADNLWRVEDTGDFNADGNADILWRHQNGTANIFFQDGATVLGGSNISAFVDNNWRCEGAGDFDADGHADILWRNVINGVTNIYRMDGTTVIGGSNTTASLDNSWSVQRIGDFDGDFSADILWRHTDGTSRLFLMDGATVVGNLDLTQQLDNTWQVGDVGDYDADGNGDILWRHTDGTARMFFMDGGTVLSQADTSVFVDNNWHLL